MSKALEKSKKLNRFWMWWNIVEAVIILAAGILAIVAGVRNDSSGNMENVLAYAISGFVILDGILRIVVYFFRYRKGDEVTPLILAGFQVSIGTLLLVLQIKANIVIVALINFISIVLMVMGVLILTYSIFQIVRKYAALVIPISTIVLAAVLIGVGIAITILYNSQDTHQQLVLIMTGSIMSIVGLAQFIVTMITAKKAKKEIKQYEKEEQGNYDVVDSKKQNAPEQKAETPEVIEAEEAHEDPAQIEGPKAIENKE
ncbi:MAG: hypothetical protein IJU64_02885 [Bacilli bacterium]|nr:hypothetical protein [Bacilli bacterium]